MAVTWVEEYLDGADLAMLVGTPWESDRAVTMLSELAAGLAELHGLDVVHRDLSPGNVRLTSSGCKVIDPGFAKHLDRSTITRFGQPGTPGFLSPEHVRHGSTPTPASDVFCVGILGWLCVTGSLPWDPSSSAYLTNLHDKQLPSVATLSAGLNPALVEILDTCLQRQIGRRYFDALELSHALVAVT